MTKFAMNQFVPQIDAKIEKCIGSAERYFNIKLKQPSYNFKQRGRTAGTAYLQRNEMRFNTFMLQQDPQKFIENVVPHEVAHIVVFQVFGAKVRPHGKDRYWCSSPKAKASSRARI